MKTKPKSEQKVKWRFPGFATTAARKEKRSQWEDNDLLYGCNCTVRQVLAIIDVNELVLKKESK